MLNNNIRSLRKSKRMSQEELAIKLNVVRQTVSKWENGISVPDSEMLIRISEVLNTPVNILLGEDIPIIEEDELKTIAAKLELLNEQIANRNENHRKVRRIVFLIICIIAVILFLCELVSVIRYYSIINAIYENTFASSVGGYDPPTDIIVSNITLRFSPLIITAVAAIIGIIGFCKTTRNK